MNETIEDKARFVFDTSKAARDKGLLSIWTVYDHPSDYPTTFVARRSEIGQGVHGPTADVITGSLAEIRRAMEMCGLYQMPRAPVDPMNIIETWM